MTDLCLPPHPALRSWINHYVLSTSQNAGEVFSNHWAASHETSMLFFLADKPTHDPGSKTADLSSLTHGVIGLQTRPNGLVHFQGQYRTFIIYFTANGFPQLFNLPAEHLLDRIIPTSTLVGPPADQLFDQLLGARSGEQMARWADNFLLDVLKKRNLGLVPLDGITHIARAITSQLPIWDVDQCAQLANMSRRNFSRRFIQQTGVSPKFYLKMVRVNQALTRKLLMPHKSWTVIAYECGYFDQAHLTNDVKQLVGLTPTQFMNQQAQSTGQLTVVDQLNLRQ